VEGAEKTLFVPLSYAIPSMKKDPPGVGPPKSQVRHDNDGVSMFARQAIWSKKGVSHETWGPALHRGRRRRIKKENVRGTTESVVAMAKRGTGKRNRKMLGKVGKQEYAGETSATGSCALLKDSLQHWSQKTGEGNRGLKGLKLRQPTRTAGKKGGQSEVKKKNWPRSGGGFRQAMIKQRAGEG